MSGTEAAASLFGSADSSSDPFATLGTELNQETSDDFFSSASPDNLAQPEATNFFETLAEEQLSPNGSTNISHNQSGVEGYGLAQDRYAPVQASAPPEVHGSPSYFNAGVQGNTSYGSSKYGLSVEHDTYTPPQAMNYTPSPNQNPSVSQSTVSTYPGVTTPAYENRNANPYAPPQPVDQYAYAPYNLYTPTSGVKLTTPTHQSHYASPQASSYSSPLPPPPAGLATVPPPPPPTATQVTRPKVLNAYDPPFPVSTYSRRNVSGSAKYGVTPPAQSAYTAYQPTSPPLPPPPRAPSVPSIPAPAPPPPPKAPNYTAAHVPPPAQSPPTQNIWTNGGVPPPTESSSYAPATYGVRPPLPPSSNYAESRNHWASSQESHDHSGTRPAIPETLPSNVENEHQTGSNFFDEIGNQSDYLEPDLAVEQHIQPASTVASSPRKSIKALSPPPRTSLDSGHISSPRQSPRPPSTSSPVYGLSHPPRASPDLRRELAQIPGARTTSPSVHIHSNTINPYGPSPKSSASRSKSNSVASIDRVSSPEASPNLAQDRYAPRGSKISNVYTAGSPGSSSARSSDGRQSTNPHPPHFSSISEASYTAAPPIAEPAQSAEDPYAPSQQTRTLKPSPSLGRYEQSPHSYSPDVSLPQEENVLKSTITPYAPSPSLLGANDPLGRTSVRVPVVSFGFGGKLITCFHDAGSLNTGFDVALSSRTSTKIQIHSWKSLVPESALDSATAFPGPLHADPGPPSTGIMKATATTQAKTKKTQLLKYLSDRVDEITQGLGYLHGGSIEKRTAEGKLVLVKLLRIMVENDGRLLGTPEIDSAVRVALVPRLEGMLSSNESVGSFTTTADTTAAFGTLSALGDGAPISVTTLRVAALDKIEEFLLRGERRQAYHYALDEKLWAHAMVIASSIDKEAWKEVVNEFIRADLGVKGDSTFALPGRADAHAPTMNGREGLRVAYSLFSGQGANAVHELVPKNILTRANGRLPHPVPTIPAPVMGQPTPKTPNFALPAAGAKLSVESLSKWAETVAMMIMSPLTPDTSAALTALGDQLLANGWLEAAHVCYLLSPQTSPVGGVGNPAVRLVLLGGKSPATLPTFSKDPDAIIFTEILEHALAAAPLLKGQEPNHGFPHLQAYRLIRAYAAAEAGYVGIASRYCEAITASLVRGSVYFTPTMLEQLKSLADRLSGVSHSDKANSWMAGKISKPSLDTIGGWLEGRFTKLVTGDPDSPASPKEDNGKADGHGYAGPFTHYNTISSTTNSARSSPAPSFVTPAYSMPPPQRTGSAMSHKTPYSHGHGHGHGHGYGIDRLPAGMESIRRKQSPGPASQTPSHPMVQTQLSNYQNGGGSYSDAYSPDSDLQTPKPAQHGEEGGGDETGNGSAQEVTWWGSSYSSGMDQGKTPTTARFEKVEDIQGGVDSNGFYSPMMNQSFAIGSRSASLSVPTSRQASMSYEDDGDDDDLGLGNSSRRKKESSPVGEGTGGAEREAKPSAAAPAPAEAEKQTDTSAGGQQGSGGWLSRWWGRKENTSGGPVKASLGETSSFYYDKELKRWVNKKAGAEAPKATPPPPPPRAQTTSPGMMAGPKPPVPTPTPPGGNAIANGNTTGGGIGLGRPASAIDLTTSPPTTNRAGSMRIRSGLAPPGLDSAPPTPTGTRIAPPGSGGPPPSRPGQKRNVRSRYVDVFAQDNAGGGSA